MGSTSIYKTKPDLSKLNDKQQKFCYEYIKDLNAARAAVAAGYSARTADAAGRRLLTNPKIDRVIGWLKGQQFRKDTLEVADIRQKLADSLNRNPGDLCDEDGFCLDNPKKIPPQCWAYLEGMTVKQTKVLELQGPTKGLQRIISQTITYKFSSMPPIIEMAMRHKGMFPKDGRSDELTVKIDWSSMYTKPKPVVSPAEEKLEELNKEIKRLEDKRPSKNGDTEE